MEISFVRSSGPGGQNVNKVNSRAILRWNVTKSITCPNAIRHRFLKNYATKITAQGEIIITSSETRDQMKNLEICYEKLRQMLIKVLKAPKYRVPSKPTRASKERRIEGKKKLGKKKQLRRVSFT